VVQGDTLRPYSERARVQTPPLSKILFKNRLTNTRLFPNCGVKRTTLLNTLITLLTVKNREKFIPKEFKDLFEEAMMTSD
jgi:hypothetical protein